MKILKETVKGRVKTVTVQIALDEKLVAIDPRQNYHVPDIDQVFHGESLAQASMAQWCQISQEWKG